MSGDARESVRQPDRPVIELDFGILVYPPETDGEPWRAVFTENGQRRFRQGATEAKLAAKLEKVKERLQADAVNMERPGTDLIAHYLDPDRLPVGERWSRKHAHTQRPSRGRHPRLHALIAARERAALHRGWHFSPILSQDRTNRGARARRPSSRPDVRS